jgi:hypothetical protein
MKKLLVGLVAATVASSSLAWGDREQAALLGAIIGGIVAGQSQRDRVEPRVIVQPPAVVIQQQEPIILYPYPVPRAPRGRVCLSHPYHDFRGVLLGYTVSCH